MAKKSATSKGYRHFQKDKNAASEKEFKTIIIGLISFVVVIALVMIGIKVYDNIGTIKVKDNVIQNVEDTWIIKNTGTNSKPSVFKMAEITAPVEGYAVRTPERTVQYTQVNYYEAEDESNPIPSYYAVVASGNYDEIPYTTYGSMSALGTIINQTEIRSGEMAGHKYYFYSLQYTADESEAQDGSEIKYREALNAYFESKFEGYSILVSVGGEVADENSFNSEEDLFALLEKVAENLVVTSRFDK